MRDDFEDFSSLGAKIVVVAPHDLDKMRSHWQDNSLPYIGIPDPGGTFSKRYGQQWKLSKLGRMPAQFVVGCEGKIAFAHYGSSMSDIPANKMVLDVIRSLSGCTTSSGAPEPIPL